MSSFDLVIASLFPDPGTMTGGLAAPGGGTHASGDWFIRFGNDLGALPRTAVHSICDGRVTKLDLTHATPETFTPKIYGAGVFVRATSAALNPDDPGGVGLFYTHIDVQPVIDAGADVVRGQVIGTVVGNPPTAPHLHFAIAERRGGQNFGVDIFQVLVEMANKPDLRTLSFFQDGSPPQVTAGPAPPPPSGS
jgi:murein DD-endopeptidase MepM/ murein hydrolase activator NlpD